MNVNFREPQLEILTLAENVGLGYLFGIGIKGVIARDNFDEDAEIGNPNTSWHGTMSSSLSGMPVLCPILIQGGIYVDLQGNRITLPDINLETVVCTVKLNKEIKKTKISGRDGTVKEMINSGDNNVEIRAIILSDTPLNSDIKSILSNGVYPYDNMAALISVLNAPIALPIYSLFLNQFDINYIVVESASFEQVEGMYGVQRVTIQAVSDKPLVIKLGTKQ